MVGKPTRVFINREDNWCVEMLYVYRRGGEVHRLHYALRTQAAVDEMRVAVKNGDYIDIWNDKNSRIVAGVETRTALGIKRIDLRTMMSRWSNLLVDGYCAKQVKRGTYQVSF